MAVVALGENLRAETMRRVHDVKLKILEGRYTHEIIDYCRDTWQIKEAQAFEYIARAKQDIQEQYEKDTESAIRLIMAELQDLYRANRKIKDYKAAHSVLKTILDHYAPSKSIIEFKTWEDEAIAEIKAGNIEFKALAEALEDYNLAVELYRRAGVASLPPKD